MKIIYQTTVAIIIISSLIVTNYCFAQTTSSTGGSATVELSNPLPTESPEVLIGNVINAVLGIVGSLALAMFIYGGLTWMLAAGNDQRVQKGKDILLWATIGLVVIFSSYALVRFVFVGLGFPQGS